jgi:hypothetical protein
MVATDHALFFQPPEPIAVPADAEANTAKLRKRRHAPHRRQRRRRSTCCGLASNGFASGVLATPTGAQQALTIAGYRATLVLTDGQWSRISRRSRTASSHSPTRTSSQARTAPKATSRLAEPARVEHERAHERRQHGARKQPRSHRRRGQALRVRRRASHGVALGLRADDGEQQRLPSDLRRPARGGHHHLWHVDRHARIRGQRGQRRHLGFDRRADLRGWAGGRGRHERDGERRVVPRERRRPARTH